MKKLITLVVILILSMSCSMTPAPDEAELRKDFGKPVPAPIIEEVAVVEAPQYLLMVEDTIKEDSVVKDSTKRITKKEELKELQKTYDERQEKVLKQIETLDEQQRILDSLIHRKDSLK